MCLFCAFRWNGLQEEIVERLKSSKGLLQLWQSYKDLYRQSDSSVQSSEERANQLLKSASRKDVTEDEVSTWIQDCAVSHTSVFTSINVSGRMTLTFDDILYSIRSC